MKKFTVRRSKWLRGEGQGCLLDHSGNMCCLGFAVNQISRVTKKRLLYAEMPSCVLKTTKETTFTTNGVFDKDFVKKAARLNDNIIISDSVREKSLTKIFKENGIEVTFKD